MINNLQPEVIVFEQDSLAAEPQFVDDKKFMIGRQDCCSTFLARLVLVLVNFFAFGIFVLIYIRDKNYIIDNYSTFPLIAFFAVIIFSLFVFLPVYFAILAVIFAFAPSCCACCCR